MDELDKILVDAFRKCIDEVIKEDNTWNIELFIEQAVQSIKHPHFYYAVIDLDSRKATYKLKKWYQWLSGKREYLVRFKTASLKDE